MICLRPGIGFALLTLGCASAPPFAPDGPYECRRAAGIVLDGRADEAAWATAEVIDGFGQAWEGRRARTATRARLLWDDRNLYFYAEMEDRDLFADLTEHDAYLWFNDVFELFFKPSEKPGYYEFQANAAGATLDVYLPGRDAGGFDKFKSVDVFDFDATVRLDGTLGKRDDVDRGWAVEGRIGWSGFAPTGGRPSPGDVWRFALCRFDYAGDGKELSSCAPLKAPNFHRTEDYLPLRFAR